MLRLYRFFTKPSPSPLLFNLIFPKSTSLSTSSVSFLVSLSVSSPFSQSSPRHFTSTTFPLNSSLSLQSKPNSISKQAAEIVALIKSTHHAHDVDSIFNSANLTLSTDLVTRVLILLNKEKLFGLPFFHWASKSLPSLSSSADMCCLLVHNCGSVGDYEAMVHILKGFKSKQICLAQNAFAFIPFSHPDKVSVMDVIIRVMKVLNEVGGSCRSTGIRSLIEMSVSFGLFDIAKSVINMTERTASYYNILLLELCRRCKFKQARDMLEEMRQFGCNPDAKSYNYLLSSLCKSDQLSEIQSVLEEMKEKGSPPNALSFEIFICHSCRLGKLEMACEYLKVMSASGIEPRLSTHAALIKGYFSLKRYEEAYNYAVACGDMYKSSSNNVYSLLASLHQKNGNPIAAQRILIEMIEKGLRPNFSVYARVFNHLQKSGKECLARNLQSRFSSFELQPITELG